MRIIAGDFRGRTIAAPAGMGTRPTTDRVRESMMSMVYSARGGFDGAVVLDAFAGSGALGLEALSRGAARAVLCDKDEGALRTVRANVGVCGLGPDRACVLRADVFGPSGRISSGGPFDLLFLDPPYALDPADIVGMVQRFAGEGLLAPSALVVYEHSLAASGRVAEAARNAGFALLKSKKFGEIAVSLLACD